jgi:signal transduction histidine kinase
MELAVKDEALLQNRQERETLKALVERQNRFTAMGEMVVKIVHDVRNPLGSIELLASLLRKELSQDDDRRIMAEQIAFGVRTINHALSNLLFFTHIPKPRMRGVPLVKIIDESLQVVSHGLLRRRIVLSVRVSPNTRVFGDEALLKQVFLNLALNALQSMPGGGTLEVVEETSMLEECDGFTEFVVRDTGSGIPEEQLHRVFDPFFTTREKGTGLGLTIVHNILQAHGGAILVESVLGKGTAFRMRLPISEGERHDSSE